MANVKWETRTGRSLSFNEVSILRDAVGECPPLGGLLCRRYYPGDSACQQFGGKQKCLLDIREVELAAETAQECLAGESARK